MYIVIGDSGINSGNRQTVDCLSASNKQPSLPNQPLDNEEPVGNELTLIPASNGSCKMLTQAQAMAENTKCVYVVHREDSRNWVMNDLKPILTKLNLDMSTPDDFIPGMTKARARNAAIKNAQKIIIVFSNPAKQDKFSNEHKWFEYELSKAEHKDPDPQSITIIPILYEGISRDDLPESVEDQILLTYNDPKFEDKIKDSIYHKSHA